MNLLDLFGTALIAQYLRQIFHSFQRMETLHAQHPFLQRQTLSTYLIGLLEFVLSAQCRCQMVYAGQCKWILRAPHCCRQRLYVGCYLGKAKHLGAL